MDERWTTGRITWSAALIALVACAPRPEDGASSPPVEGPPGAAVAPAQVGRVVPTVEPLFYADDQPITHTLANRVIAVGSRGQANPVASNEDEAGRAQNRRVEFYFYYPDGEPLAARFDFTIVIAGE